jgi:D-alanyl-D-alanine carboxypeptidase (penicillin-binding protein 5/6)
VPKNSGAYWGPRFREADAAALFDWGFASYKTIRFPLPVFADAKIWKGKQSRASVIAQVATELSPTALATPTAIGALTIAKSRGIDLNFRIEMIKNLTAPVPAGTVAGEWIIQDNGGILSRIPLITTEDVPRGNILKRAFDSIIMFFRGIKS